MVKHMLKILHYLQLDLQRMFDHFVDTGYFKVSLHNVLATDHVHLGQGIQEWTKQNLWKTAFKNLK